MKKIYEKLVFINIVFGFNSIFNVYFAIYIHNIHLNQFINQYKS